MQKILKTNIKSLSKKYEIDKILNINKQSVANKLSDNNRKFSIEDLMLISKATGITTDKLLFEIIKIQ